MSLVRSTARLFWISFTSILVTSLTFLWMPFIQENRFGLVVTGIIFWVTLFLGYILLYIANKKRKCCDSEFNKKDDYKIKTIGLFKFFSNFPAIIADSILLLCIVFCFIMSITNLGKTYLPYFVLFLFVFSLNSHCLFNGKIYKFISKKHFRGDEDYD